MKREYSFGTIQFLVGQSVDTGVIWGTTWTYYDFVANFRWKTPIRKELCLQLKEAYDHQV